MSQSIASGQAMPAIPASSSPIVRAGTVLLVLLPLAMWLANRSAPLVLGLAALCFAAAAVARFGWAAWLSRLRGVLGGAVGLSLCGFLAWSLLTVAWSHRPIQSLAMWGEFALPLTSGVVIVASGCFRPERAESRALAVAVIAAAAFMMAELATGLSARIAFDIGKQVTYIFNRPALTCLVLLPAAAAGLLAGKRAAPADRLLCAALFFAVAGIAIYSDSGASGLGLLIMGLIWIAARLLPRLTLAAVALGFLATMALAPAMGRVADGAMPQSLHERLAGSHTRDRVDIWLSFGEAAMARPLLGAGFGTSPTLDRHPVALEVSPPRRVLLAVGHPHSAPVQAWVETGAVGALLLTFAGLAFLWRLRRLQASALASRLALAAAGFGVATVAHGAWQGWWIAALALSAAWLFCGLPSEREDG
jgi:O-antigen ligase